MDDTADPKETILEVAPKTSQTLPSNSPSPVERKQMPKVTECDQKSIGELFLHNYEQTYLDAFSSEYFESESLEQMNLRHEIEALELEKLHIKQKDLLLKKLSNSNKASVKESAKKEVLKIKAKKVENLEAVAEDNEDRTIASDDLSFSSVHNSNQKLSQICEALPSLRLEDRRVFNLDEAKRLLESLPRSEIASEIRRTISTSLGLNIQVQSPEEVRRLQLSLSIIYPESNLLPTGQFGRTTDRYLKQAQREAWLDDDGLITPDQWPRLVGSFP